MMRAPPTSMLVGGGGSQSDIAGAINNGGQGGAVVGGAESNRDMFDEIYSFGAIKRLCARHMKKLKQEQNRLEVSETAYNRHGELCCPLSC